MGLIGVQTGCLVAIGTAHRRLHLLEARHLRQLAQDISQVRIREVALVEQLTDILHSRWDRLDEVLLTLEIATEAVGSQHLQLAEQHEE